MADYSMATQMQGPDIKVSLFSDAMQAGINAGNTQKTTGQAIAEGISTGIDKGLATYENIQNIQIKQNQIDQQPVINQLRQQQAEEGALNLEKQRIQTQAALENKQQILDNTKSQLEDEGLKIQEDLNKRKREAELDQRWQEAQGPLERKQLIFSGEYADVFANDPKKYQQYGGSLSGYFNPVETATFKATMAKSNVADAYAKDKEKYQVLAPKLEEELYSDADFTAAQQAAGLTKPQAARRLKYVRSGYYELDGNRNRIPADKGKYKLNEKWDSTVKTYDIFDGTKLVASDVPEDSHKRFIKNRDAQNILNNVYQNTENAYIDRQARAEVQQAESRQQAASLARTKSYAPSLEADVAKAEKGQKAELAPITDPRAAAKLVIDVPVKTAENTINLSGGKNNKSYEVARNILGVPENKFIEVKPAVQSIFRVLESPKEGLFSSYSMKQKAQIVDAKKNIIDKLGTLEYKTNPESKKLYNQAAVDIHNATVKEFKDAFNAGGPGGFFANGANKANFAAAMISLGTGEYKGIDVQTLREVDSPLDLCILKNSSKYNDAADNIINSFNSRIEGAKKADIAAGQLPTKWASTINE